jgi:hypothetical protein
MRLGCVIHVPPALDRQPSNLRTAAGERKTGKGVQRARKRAARSARGGALWRLLVPITPASAPTNRAPAARGSPPPSLARLRTNGGPGVSLWFYARKGCRRRDAPPCTARPLGQLAQHPQTTPSPDPPLTGHCWAHGLCRNTCHVQQCVVVDALGLSKLLECVSQFPLPHGLVVRQPAAFGLPKCSQEAGPSRTRSAAPGVPGRSQGAPQKALSASRAPTAPHQRKTRPPAALQCWAPSSVGRWWAPRLSAPPRLSRGAHPAELPGVRRRKHGPPPQRGRGTPQPECQPPKIACLLVNLPRRAYDLRRRPGQRPPQPKGGG